jgi:hypothetical protein
MRTAIKLEIKAQNLHFVCGIQQRGSTDRLRIFPSRSLELAKWFENVRVSGFLSEDAVLHLTILRKTSVSQATAKLVSKIFF